LLQEKLQRGLDSLLPLRRKLATGVVAVFILLVGFHVVFGKNGLVVYYHKRAEYQKLTTEIDDLQKENERLASQVQKLKTADPKVIEKEAREQLKYARPGEVVYTMPTPNTPPPNATAKK
jgi:cell division protein FtsB